MVSVFFLICLFLKSICPAEIVTQSTHKTEVEVQTPKYWNYLSTKEALFIKNMDEYLKEVLSISFSIMFAISKLNGVVFVFTEKDCKNISFMMNLRIRQETDESRKKKMKHQARVISRYLRGVFLAND